jgi:hypothetical protein
VLQSAGVPAVLFAGGNGRRRVRAPSILFECACLSGKGAQAGVTMSRLVLRRKVKAKLAAKPPAPVADDKATGPVQPPPERCVYRVAHIC